MTHFPPSDDRPIDYDEKTEDDYAAFADDCEVVLTSRGFRLLGRCRRCGDDMSYEVVDRFYRGGVRPQPSPFSQSGKSLRMLCTCRQDHPGRPQDEEGCGAYWSVDIHKS